METIITEETPTDIIRLTDKQRQRQIYNTTYQTNHKEQISRRKKLYYQQNKEKQLKYTNDYNNTNKDQIKKKREVNKTEVNRKQRERYHMKKEQRLMGEEDRTA